MVCKIKVSDHSWVGICCPDGILRLSLNIIAGTEFPPSHTALASVEASLLLKSYTTSIDDW